MAKSWKQVAEQQRIKNSINMDGIAFAQGLSEANREFVAERLLQLSLQEDSGVFKSFVAQVVNAFHPNAKED